MSSTGLASTKRAETPESGGASPPPDSPLFVGPPEPRPDLAVAARAGLLMMTTLMLVGLCLTLAFRPPQPPPVPENSLRADISSPKLNTVRIPPAPPPQVTAAPPAKERVVQAVPTALSKPAVHEAPVAQLARVSQLEMPSLVEPAPEPVRLSPAFLEDLLAARALHRGDNSMIRNWKLFGMPAFLAVVLAVDPLPAAAQFDGVLLAVKGDQPATQPAADTGLAEQLKKIQATLDTSIKATDEDLKTLRDSLAALRKDIAELREGHRTTDLNVTKAQSDLNDLKSQIALLQKDVEDLKKRQTTSSISGYAPLPAGAPSGQGRLRLLNSYFLPETVRINDRTYTLQPGEERWIEAVPAGSFTYEVIGVTDPRTRTLVTNDVFTINVHPRG